MSTTSAPLQGRHGVLAREPIPANHRRSASLSERESVRSRGARGVPCWLLAAQGALRVVGGGAPRAPPAARGSGGRARVRSWAGGTSLVVAGRLFAAGDRSGRAAGGQRGAPCGGAPARLAPARRARVDRR